MGSSCIAQGAQLGALWCPRGVGWGIGGRLKREGIYIYIHITDSRGCTGEANTTLQSNYTPNKK